MHVVMCPLTFLIVMDDVWAAISYDHYLDVCAALDVFEHPPRRGRVQVPQVDWTQVQSITIVWLGGARDRFLRKRWQKIADLHQIFSCHKMQHN